MNQRSRLSLIVTQTLVLSLMLALFGRLFYLQVASGLKYQNAALSIQSRDIVNPAIRGAITDSSGIPLAMDRPGMQITVNRSLVDALPDKGTAVFAQLGKLLSLTPAQVYTKTRLCGELAIGKRAGCWNGTRQQPIPLTKVATEAQALKVLENPTIFPGVDAAPVPIRSYPTLAGENAAHVLGYTGVVTDADLADPNKKYYQNEVVGKSGLEYIYDNYLRGTPGVKTLIVDRKEAITSVSQNTAPTAGNNLVTHLDARLQSATEKALATSVQRSRSLGYHADSGAAIVMDVTNGAILAMASYPTYDPNMWQKGLTPQQAKDLFSVTTGVPALSRAIQGEYAPASTFKAISIVAASAAHYNLNVRYDCPAQLKVGTQLFRNFETKSQGNINMTEAIAVSCDTIWYQIAFDQWLKDGGLSPHPSINDYFFNAARGFGVGKKTGIDLPGELAGRLPDRQWKQNYYDANKNFFCNYTKRAKPSDLTPYLIAIAHENCLDGNKLRAGDAVNFAIGQGDTLVTPLQLTDIYASIANGGTLWKPEVAKAVLTPTGKVVKTFAPVSNGKAPATASDISFLHTALRAVATRGTAAGVFANFPIEVAGKTGTGQVLGRNPNGSAKDDTSWFASFAPLAKPRYAVVMMVSQGGFGASVSAVGVKDIYSAIFGVTGNKVDPSKAIFPASGPVATLPKVDPKYAKLAAGTVTK
ncbi:MAG: penicillin-binding protein 2 [Actinomycetes bacterium]